MAQLPWLREELKERCELNSKFELQRLNDLVTRFFPAIARQTTLNFEFPSDFLLMHPDRYLSVAAILFTLGGIGFLTRRNLILMILSAEMMLHGVSLTLNTFSKIHGNAEGQVFTIMILTVAACEAGLALSLILALYRSSKTLDIDLWSSLRESDMDSPRDPGDSSLRAPASHYDNLPKLTPAGRSLEIRGDRKENATHV